MSFRIPKRGGNRLTNNRKTSCFGSVLGLSTARLDKLSSLRSPRKIVLGTRGLLTSLCKIPGDFFLIGKSASKGLTVIVSTTGRGRAMLIRQGYRGSVLGNVALTETGPIFLTPRFGRR